VRTAVFDACVLYPAPLRDFLLRLTKSGVVDGFWSSAILDECFRSVARNRPDLPAGVLEASRAAMETYFPSRLISGHEPLIEGMSLPDPNDRHVLAAAIHGEVSSIVTFNLKDFPAIELARYNVVAMHPDEFVLAAIRRAADGLIERIGKMNTCPPHSRTCPAPPSTPPPVPSGHA
jgi:predicted nucleic acid-binding protein